MSGKAPPPLARLARRLLSVCANSATCERLFSLFGQLLTKLRNRMSTKTLVELAELKMHLRDEYAKDAEMKARLRRHCGPQADESGSAAQALTVDESSDDDTDMELDYDDPESESELGVSSGDLHGLSDEFRRSQADDHDTAISQSGIARAYSRTRSDDPNSTDGFPITIGDLFDFESRVWVNHIRAFASRSLDAELELYELLDMDAEGEADEGGEMDDTAQDVIYA